MMLAKNGDSTPAPAPWARIRRLRAVAVPVSMENVRADPFAQSGLLHSEGTSEIEHWLFAHQRCLMR
jgi:hypothetical protein